MSTKTTATKMLSREERTSVVKLAGNDKCVDCDESNPTWCSVSLGILMCLECSGRHRGLGTHLSFVRSMDMDAFTDKQLKALQLGGNDACNEFLNDHGIVEVTKSIPGDGLSIRTKYDNPAAELYRQKIKARIEGREEPIEISTTNANKGTPTSNSTSAAGGGGQQKRQELDFTNTSSGPNIIAAYLTGFQFSNFINIIVLRNLTSSIGTIPTLGVVGAVVGTAILSGGKTAIGFSAKTLSAVIAGLTVFVNPFNYVYHMRKSRVSAMKTSVRDFEKRCMSGRAKKGGSRGPKATCQYEVFFPPETSIGDHVDIALVFYPGMFIDHLAYAKILGGITDKTPDNNSSKKILVVLVNAEPHRISHTIATPQHLKSIQHEISKLMGISVGEWVVGGHSLGAWSASALFTQPDLPTGIKRMVEWGSKQVHHLEGSKQLQSVLKIDASNDGIFLELEKTFGKFIMIDKYPPTCQITSKTIVGGNHSGFAHYEGQSFPCNDRNRIGITLDEQQRMIVDWTTDFLAGQQ